MSYWPLRRPASRWLRLPPLPTRRPQGCRSRCARTASISGRSTASPGRGLPRRFARSSARAGCRWTASRARRPGGRSAGSASRSTASGRLRRGRVGWDVSVLQFLLARHGIGRVIDGYFGAETSAAVRRFQRRTGLVVDGVAGPQTLTALRGGRVVRSESAAHYLVRSGDSLTSIAQRYRTSVRSLARANRLDPARPLLIGTKLRVPASITAAAGRPAGRRARPDQHSGRPPRCRSRARARGRLDGVRLPAPRRLDRRRAGRHAGDAADLGLRRDGPARPEDRRRRRRGTSRSASSSSATCCESSPGTSGSPSPRTTRARRPSASTASSPRRAPMSRRSGRSRAAFRDVSRALSPGHVPRRRCAAAPLRSNWASSVEPVSASGGAEPAGDGARDLVEVAGADLALVARRRVAVVLERELALLQARRTRVMPSAA